MRYLFMDNFRGFTRTLIPLRSTSFLVGENSSGKSSFLALVYLLSNPKFWFNQDFSLGESCSLGGYEDIVSAASVDRSQFTVGTLVSMFPETNKDKTDRLSFSLLTFQNEDSIPRLCRYTQYSAGQTLRLTLSPESIKYKFLDGQPQFREISEACDGFLSLFDSHLSDKRGFNDFPEDFSGRPPLPYIVAVLLSEPTARSKAFAFRTELPMMDLTWLAPIRTKPRRIYDSIKTEYSPEGDHTPYVIRQALASREKGERFVRLLERFGKESGLFDTIDAHTFGDEPSAPFEVQVHISSRPLNISNVGYGVSQVLPVIVEMLTRPKGHWFAIQQPEVHLHPRAQAALGELIHLLAIELGHHYLIETHSDYLVDRFRLRLRETGRPTNSQVLFFERTAQGNAAYPLRFDSKGHYPLDQPESFRRFFINEEVSLLEL
ncbi:MAG: hypothetical protein EA424_10905 [Planctomycetaceae bacterium]|nr:MAG: hypothetical protein EA424_10905 [Planctomycetaceae bacterium]